MFNLSIKFRLRPSRRRVSVQVGRESTASSSRTGPDPYPGVGDRRPFLSYTYGHRDPSRGIVDGTLYLGVLNRSPRRRSTKIYYFTQSPPDANSLHVSPVRRPDPLDPRSPTTPSIQIGWTSCRRRDGSVNSGHSDVPFTVVQKTENFSSTFRFNNII